MLLENNLEMLTEYENYLNNHRVKEDRFESLSILPYVANMDLVQASNINPDIVIDLIYENMLNKGAVKAICTYLHPNFEEMLHYLMGTSSDFEAIVPLSVAKNMLTQAMDYKTEHPPKNKYFNIKPVIDEDLQIVLVVSKDKVLLGLTWFTGKFNKNCVLISHEPVVIDWAYTLYTEYDFIATKYLSLREIIIKKQQFIK